MIVKINGEEKDIESGISVSQLLEHLELSPGRVVVELNTKVVARNAHGSTRLNAGDQLEIVHFVGGG